MHMMVMFPISYDVCKALEDARRKTIKINCNCTIVGGWKQGYLVNVDKQTSFMFKQLH
jgi:hypothetical protein